MKRFQHRAIRTAVSYADIEMQRANSRELQQGTSILATMLFSCTDSVSFLQRKVTDRDFA